MSTAIVQSPPGALGAAPRSLRPQGPDPKGRRLVYRSGMFFFQVGQGDSLTSIAETFGKKRGAALQLARANKLGTKPPAVGFWLQIPASWVYPEKAKLIRDQAAQIMTYAKGRNALRMVKGGALGDWWCPEGYTPVWSDEDDEIDPFECMPDPENPPPGTGGGDGSPDPKWGTGCGDLKQEADGNWYSAGYYDPAGARVPCGAGRVFDQVKQGCVDRPQKAGGTPGPGPGGGGTPPGPGTDKPTSDQPGMGEKIVTFLKKPAVMVAAVGAAVVGGAVVYKRRQKRRSGSAA